MMKFFFEVSYNNILNEHYDYTDGRQQRLAVSSRVCIVCSTRTQTSCIICNIIFVCVCVSFVAQPLIDLLYKRLNKRQTAKHYLSTLLPTYFTLDAVHNCENY